MPKAFTISLQGMSDAQRVIRNAAEAAEEVEMEVRVSAFAIEAEAKRNIQQNGSKDQGLLSSSGTTLTEPDGQTFTVWFQAYYAPFVEFGTGGRVSIPAEWKELAAQYQTGYSRGSFDDFVINIVDWMKRKGIVPDSGTDVDDYDNAAFYIALKILHNGLEPRPFLFPAFDKVRRELIGRVQQIYNNLA